MKQNNITKANNDTEKQIIFFVCTNVACLNRQAIYYKCICSPERYKHTRAHTYASTNEGSKSLLNYQQQQQQQQHICEL